ncbi:MAG TPA: hypothetical protein PLA19_01290 [Candidatus Pacearchaeota archaeon]|nr:hypothetical protein [Candidatus Pacearchaeota archaeon]
MSLKSKILLAGLAAIIAGGTIFGANCALAQTDGAQQTDPAIAQMMQMIETLKQQIQQIIALIAQLKPQETCGNGKCRFGETAATCPADCGQQIADCAKEGEIYGQAERCCGNLTPYLFDGREKEKDGVCVQTQKLWDNGYSFYKCINCGDGKCNSAIGENTCNCSADCARSSTNCAKEGQTRYNIGNLLKCCDGLIAVSYDDPVHGSEMTCAKCGNGICNPGETPTNCPADCDIKVNCAKEGEIAYWDTNTSNINQCCSGLTAVMNCSPTVACSKSANSICTYCGNGVCGKGENAYNCPADCQNSAACKTLWWSDNTSKICQQKQFCGAYMYSGLKTYETQAACQKTLDAACSKECVEKGYALGGNYCVANEYGILETCCCTGASTSCENLWWSDDTHKICQQKQFCGIYMYSSLKTYNTQSACQTALDATCSKECVEKGYALGGNYCVANEYGVLEACCCTGTSSK